MTQAEFIAQYEEQWREWCAIRDEMLFDRCSVTAYQVTLEQRKRLLARGKKLLTFSDIDTAESV